MAFQEDISIWQKWAWIGQGLGGLATVIAAGWAVRWVIWRREHKPRLELDLTIRFVGIEGAYHIAELVATVKNSGLVWTETDEFSAEIYAIRRDAPLRLNLDGADPWRHIVEFEPYIPQKMLTGRVSQPVGEARQTSFSFIDPGTTHEFRHPIAISDSLSFILARAQLVSHDAQGREIVSHRQTCLREVPDRESYNASESSPSA